MTADPKMLRAALREADARCQTARKIAEEAQGRFYQAGGFPLTAAKYAREYDLAMERFLVAAEVKERARRAWAAAEGARAAS